MGSHTGLHPLHFADSPAEADSWPPTRRAGIAQQITPVIHSIPLGPAHPRPHGEPERPTSFTSREVKVIRSISAYQRRFELEVVEKLSDRCGVQERSLT